jgi:hypothetical protein
MRSNVSQSRKKAFIEFLDVVKRWDASPLPGSERE